MLGGVFGYLIGMFAFEFIEPLLHQFGYWQTFQTAVEWFAVWGFWVVLLAGFSLIPYKVFTIAAGIAGTVGMVFIPFLLASIIGLVAAVSWWRG